MAVATAQQESLLSVAQHGSASSARQAKAEGCERPGQPGQVTAANPVFGLSGACKRVALRPLWPAVIGRPRLQLDCPAKMPSLGDESQAQDLLPRS
jgi:hypothetical protein